MKSKINFNGNEEQPEESAAALTALLKNYHTPEGASPTEEELVAFIDHKLDDIEEARVKSHIARDKVVYNRWISQVTHLQSLEKQSVHSRSNSLPIFHKIANFLNSTWIKSAMTAAAAGVLILVLTPGQKNIDDYYTNFPMALEEMANLGFQAKALPFGKKPTLIAAVEWGVYKRVQTVLSEEKIRESKWRFLTSSKPVPTSQVSGDMINLAVEIGEYSILQHTYCRQNTIARDEFLEATNQYTRSLITEMNRITVSEKLGISFNENSSASCKFSEEILKLL